jgi:cephalosporin hydroxylase
VDEVYEELFANIRHSTRRVLEIGVEGGGSLMMWKEYFPNATVWGVDTKTCPQIEGKERLEFVHGDAYSPEVASSLPSGFDVIIEDGPHTLESITFVVEEYSGKLNSGGIMVLEDFQDSNWTNIIRRSVPDGFKAEVMDLRRVKGRYDDIVMIIART